MANSIKHDRTAQNNRVELQSTVMVEVEHEGFRFIRNTILASYPDGNTFDAIEELCQAIRLYFPVVGFTGPDLTIPENDSYQFYPHVVAYHRDDLSVYIKNVTFTPVRRKQGVWVPIDPPKIGFIVLDKAEIGKDPRPFFPKDAETG